MSEQNKTDGSESDAALEREIRRDRKFSMNEALGRMAGQGVMKGASPIPPRQQAEFEIGLYLRKHLSDASGVLPVVLLRRVKCSDLLLQIPTEPLNVLSAYLRRLLQSPDLLREFVREVDVEWGQLLGDRPYFEKEQQPPHPEDPYTFESVRADLLRLLDTLPPEDVQSR